MNHRISLGAAGVLALGVIAAGGVAVAATSSPTLTTTASSPATSSSASPSSASSSSASPSSGRSGKDLVLPAGSVLADRTTKFCERSDDIVDRLTKREATLADKATAAKRAAARAKAEKRVATLRKHNYDKRAGAVQKRIDRRSERVTKLPDRLETVKAAAQECASLGIS